MTRRRLELPQGRVSELARTIRERYVECPRGGNKYQVLEWYLGRVAHVPLAKSITKKKAPKDSDWRDGFLSSYEWRKVRMEVLVERGARCECCGASPSDGRTVINVDHIQPRKRFPALALVKANLQVLCHVCNHGKGNWDETDWREATRQSSAPAPIVGFVVTEAWLDQYCTIEHGRTRRQFELLGVRWPPQHGWKERMCGLTIAIKAQKEVEAIAERAAIAKAARSAAQADEYERWKPCWATKPKAVGVLNVERDMRPRMVKRSS